MSRVVARHTTLGFRVKRLAKNILQDLAILILMAMVAGLVKTLTH